MHEHVYKEGTAKRKALTDGVREMQGKVSKLVHCNEKEFKENTAEKERGSIQNDFTLITI
jgi:hypothetical protein